MDSENPWTTSDESPSKAECPPASNSDVEGGELPKTIYFRSYRSDSPLLPGDDEQNSLTSAIKDNADGKPGTVSNQAEEQANVENEDKRSGCVEGRLLENPSTNCNEPGLSFSGDKVRHPPESVPVNELTPCLYFRCYRTPIDSRVPDRDVKKTYRNNTDRTSDRNTCGRGGNRYHPYDEPTANTDRKGRINFPPIPHKEGYNLQANVSQNGRPVSNLSTDCDSQFKLDSSTSEEEESGNDHPLESSRSSGRLGQDGISETYEDKDLIIGIEDRNRIIRTPEDIHRIIGSPEDRNHIIGTPEDRNRIIGILEDSTPIIGVPEGIAITISAVAVNVNPSERSQTTDLGHEEDSELEQQPAGIFGGIARVGIRLFFWLLQAMVGKAFGKFGQIQ